MTLTLKFQDTFTGSDGTSLASHSPDLDTPGGGWNVWNGAIAITSNKSQDNNTGSGNRANTGAFSTIDVDVQATIDDPGGGAVNVFSGVAARNTSQTTANGIEFYYDFLTGKWIIDDNSGTVGSVTLTETPTFPALIKLECRSGVATGYYWNGSVWVQKVQLTGVPTTSTRKHCGVLQGNSTGGGRRSVLDSFEVYEYSAGGSVAPGTLGFFLNES